ncbi:MAG TPA: hypothetical protein VM536_09760 [Chloroflexia bacterium]|nr:hypothetical protein [Chloroflexia bacterium]
MDDPAGTDEATHARNRAVRRLKKIGSRLIEGPRSLIPPRELDDFGWLEPNLRLVWLSGRRRESLIIYCDETMNREAGFLTPVLRHARWNSLRDLRDVPIPVWPSVRIHLSSLETVQDQAGAAIRRIETAMSRPPYIPFGLNAHRDVPSVDFGETAEDRGHMEIECRNGTQTLTWTSWALGPGDAFSDLFFATIDELRALVVPMPRGGWQEAYDFDLTADPIRRSWYWDGQAPGGESVPS